MSLELDLIQAINESPDDRTPQLIYADWLDDLGDPRGEAWRVLVEQGKRPDHRKQLCNGFYSEEWYWWYKLNPGYGSRSVQLYDLVGVVDQMLSHGTFPTFHAAMDAAAIAWVRYHRDPDFLREESLK